MKILTIIGHHFFLSVLLFFKKDHTRRTSLISKVVEELVWAPFSARLIFCALLPADDVCSKELSSRIDEKEKRK